MIAKQPYATLGRFLSDQFRQLRPQDETDSAIARALSDIRAEVDDGGKAVAHTTIARWKNGQSKPEGKTLELLLEYFEDSHTIEAVEGGRDAIEQAIRFLSQPAEVLSVWYERDDVPALALNSLKTVFPKPDPMERASKSAPGAQVNIRNNHFGQGGIKDTTVEDRSRLDIEGNEADTFIVDNLQVGSKREKDPN